MIEMQMRHERYYVFLVGRPTSVFVTHLFTHEIGVFKCSGIAPRISPLFSSDEIPK